MSFIMATEMAMLAADDAELETLSVKVEAMRDRVMALDLSKYPAMQELALDLVAQADPKSGVVALRRSELAAVEDAEKLALATTTRLAET